MTRPSRNSTLMSHAYIASSRATCSRQSVGVVIARDGRVLVTGYNGAPAGMNHCDHTGEVKVHYDEVTRKELYGTMGQPPDPGCKVSVHAEANAIAYAARWGIKIEGAQLFTTFTPCLACAQLIVNAGLTKVVYAALYRDRRGLELCQKAKIEVVHEKDMDRI